MYGRLLALFCLAFPLASLGCGCGKPGYDPTQQSCPCCPSGSTVPPSEQLPLASQTTDTNEKTAESGQSDSAAQQPGTTLGKPAVNVVVVGGPAFKRELKKYQGKVVLVDFWATWCGPCVEMFPKTVDLHRRLADRGLVVVGVSMDDPDDKTQVADFLAQHGATFPNYISRYGVGSEGAEAFGVSMLPTYKLYDRQGELVREFTGAGIDTAELEKEIEKLLSQP